VDYAEAIDYILSFTDMERGFQASPDPVMSLGSMRSLLSRLNNPQEGRHTVHVTGSKGKGATAHMIEGILRHSGHSTALFTSPHLHSYTERIRIGEDAVSMGEFAAGLGAIRAAVDAEKGAVNGNVSTFGVLTALFFWLVRAQALRVEWQVVEVGLGGRFDATNVFTDTDIAVFTPISLEHTQILGSTTLEIASDKSGIIRPGSIVVVAPQHDPAVVDLLRDRTAEAEGEFIDVAASYRVEPLEKHVYGQSFALHGPEGTRELRTPMLGFHQLQNASTAVAVAEALRRRGDLVSESGIANGITRTRVPGRLEVMGSAPAIVVDGAHNGESAAALVAALRDYLTFDKCAVVFGCTRDKDYLAIGRELAQIAGLIICTRINSPRTTDPGVLVEALAPLGVQVAAAENLAAAMDIAMGFVDERGLICVAGSLYLAAEARERVLGESVVR